MHHIITTLPQFLALFIGMFALVGALDWIVRKHGSTRIKALMLSVEDVQFPGGGIAGNTLDARVSRLERAFDALSHK